MENYRTFIGIPLKVEDSFMQGRSLLMKALEGERISWVTPGSFHLTLRFLGDQDKEKIRVIQGTLRENLCLPAFRPVHLSGLGYFGSRRAPKVLWVGLQDEAYLQDLRQHLDALLKGCGFRLEEQEYRPHLTLGRIRGLEKREAFFRVVEGHSGDFHSPVEARDLVLFKSALTSGGAIHTPLATVPLG